MEPRAHHILVGIFTLVISIAAIGFSLWLAKAGSDKETANYTVAFTEAVRGLNRGAAVQYNGIRIGEVTKLELDPTDISQVLASISIQSNIPIREDTRARFTVTSITGSSVIELVGGNTANSPKLTSKTPGQPPVIQTIPSPISQLMSGGEDLMTNISELVLNANAFLTAENAHSISNSVSQLERLLAQLADGSENLPDLLSSLTKTSLEAEQMLGAARSFLAQEGHDVFTQTHTVMQSLESATKELQQLISSNAPAINQGTQGFAQLSPIMQELRQAVSSINIITREIQNNPKGYLLGADKLQEFQP